MCSVSGFLKIKKIVYERSPKIYSSWERINILLNVKFNFHYRYNVYENYLTRGFSYSSENEIIKCSCKIKFTKKY